MSVNTDMNMMQLNVHNPLVFNCSMIANLL